MLMTQMAEEVYVGVVVPTRKCCKANKSVLIEHAELILPWLTPQELANISITCKSLYKVSKSITLQRSFDASRTFENFPIPFHNNTLLHHPYTFFLYTPTLLLPLPLPLPSHNNNNNNNLPRQRWGGNSVISPSLLPSQEAESVSVVNESGRVVSGCECGEACLADDCVCLGFQFDDVDRECGPGCLCGPECGNRLSRKGVAVKVKIVRDERKGWGLFADQFITKGNFLFHYAGELLTTKEAQMRQQHYDELASRGRFSSALLVVREHLPSGKACLRLNIDATRIGNVARFVNHSCDGGNLSTKLVRSSGALFPRLCFFALKDIQEDEELTFSYGEIRKKPSGLPCFCNSPSCFGTLPSEDT